MEGKGNLLKWVLLGLSIVLFAVFGFRGIFGKNEASERQPLIGRDYSICSDKAREDDPKSCLPKEAQDKPEQLCRLGDESLRFRAELTSKGAALKHVLMTDEKYLHEIEGKLEPIDLVSTMVPYRAPLRIDLRSLSGGTDQVPYHDLDWSLASQTKSSCVFEYRDDKVEVVKTISTTERPFELKVDLTVKNLSKEEQKHRLAVEQTDWRTVKMTQGSFLSRSTEWMTVSEVRTNDETTRFNPDDFEPGDFDDAEFTEEKWRRAPGTAVWAAVSSSYFSKAIIHLEGPARPAGEALIEEIWNQRAFPKKESDPHHGHVYRARLVYQPQKLKPDTSTTYSFLAYVGPKERAVLSVVGGKGFDSTELLDLGMFGWIGKVLIQYLYLLFGLIKNWGWAICLLTITVKIVLFPLSISQIKSSMAMRRLKPEMDEINKKFKDDAQQRGLAIQELWRKNKVTNPMLGCLPVLLQMPVWFALYTALQTAVELYHTPFGPFIPDLSAPGKYFIIPILLGGSSFLQQHLMPMQGDAMQQKMMKYMMPAIFTVMMLFLPAGLGIYFMTNTWLSIGQQLAVEKYFKRAEEKSKPAENTKSEAKKDDGKDKSRAFGKGKTRVQQRG